MSGLFFYKDYIFKDQIRPIMQAYEQSDAEQRRQLDAVFEELGYFGVQVLGRVLYETRDRAIRGQIVTTLTRKPEEARRWSLGILIAADHPWFVYRNALMILRQVSADPADAERVMPFLSYGHSRVRLEAINAILELKPREAENLIINCLRDMDDRVSWRAMKAMAELPEVSEGGIHDILAMIDADIKEGSGGSSGHLKHAARLVTAIYGLPNIANPAEVESRIIELVHPLAFKEKKWQRFLKAVPGSEEEIRLLKAVIFLLGRIGGNASENFLQKLSRLLPDLSDPAQQVIRSISDPSSS